MQVQLFSYTHSHAMQFAAAVDDAQRSIALDPRGWRAYIRLADAHINLGAFTGACDALNSGLSALPGHEQVC